VFAIPIKRHVPDRPDPERRERIQPRVTDVPEVEAGAVMIHPGEEVAVGAETETGD
jgi:hypothetical protein